MENSTVEPATVDIKKPKKVFHCSDGVYEEYSDEDAKEDTKSISNEAQSWPAKVGSSIVNALDYAGETLGELLNITTPKYSYEIEQFKKDQERRAKEEAIEKANTWDVEKNQNVEPVTQVPTKNLERF